jgi:hypothetical protein
MAYEFVDSAGKNSSKCGCGRKWRIIQSKILLRAQQIAPFFLNSEPTYETTTTKKE